MERWLSVPCGQRTQLTPFHGKASPSPHSPPLSTSTSSLFSLALEGRPCCFWESRGPEGFGEGPGRRWALAPGTGLLAQAASSAALLGCSRTEQALCVRLAPAGQPGPVPSTGLALQGESLPQPQGHKENGSSQRHGGQRDNFMGCFSVCFHGPILTRRAAEVRLTGREWPASPGPLVSRAPVTPSQCFLVLPLSTRAALCLG